MKKYTTLRGAFFCETCNTSTSSRFCIDCGNKCIESLPSPATKKIFCTECGIPAPSVTTRFCTGCGTVLQPLSAAVPASTPTNSAAMEEEKRRKQEEALAAQKAREEEARRIQEEKIRREAAEAEAKRKQEAEARRRQEEEEAARVAAAAEKLRIEEEKKRQQDDMKRKQDALQAQQRKTQTFTRFCIECGAKSTIPTAKFCVQCGKTFDDLPPTSPTSSLPSPSSASTPVATHALPPVPTAAPPPLPVSASPRSPPSSPAPRIQGIVGRKPATPTLRGPLRPPCRKCGAPTGPRFCTQCGEKTDEELERIRIAGGGAPPVAVTAATSTAEVPRDRGQTTVLRSELADTQKELKRQAAEAARAEARANALQAQLEEAQRRTQAASGTAGALDAEAEATRALRAMLEERERELKRMQELLNPSAQPDEPAYTPEAPPMAPDIDFAAYTPAPAPVKSATLKPSAASLHDQLKTATLKKAVIVARPKSTSSADGRLRGATFLGAMQRIQAATSKDIDDDDDGEWDED